MSNQDKNNTEISTFKSIRSFWEDLIQDKKWYLNYSPQQFNQLKIHEKELAPLIAEETNKLRYMHSFKQEDYLKIMQWDNIVYNANQQNLLLQFCSNCKTKINLSPRYPKAICENCKDQLKSAEGRKVEFFNTNILGTGCKGYYKETNQQEEYNTTECYIGNKKFRAEEDRFGGIVIQLKYNYTDNELV